MRVRFAPSPTGQLHVGNARTALFNWLLARGSRRHVRPAHRGHRRRALDARVGGGHPARPAVARARLGRGSRRRRRVRAVPAVRAAAPVRVVREGAAERRAGVLLLLLAASSSRPSAARRSPPAGRPATRARAGGCRRDEARGADRRRASGRRSGFACRRTARSSFADAVRGEVRFHTDVIGDPVIVRADGTPAYNFAVVVDDALMAITHVIRGEDHISNTPRQILLYEALGLRAADVRAPGAGAGARSQPAVEASRRDVGRGVPSEGLSAGGAGQLSGADRLVARADDDDELLPVEELARRFSLDDVGQSAGVFDEEKLAWVNRHYLKMAAPARLAELVGAVLRARGRGDDAGRAGPRVSGVGDADRLGVGRSARSGAGAARRFCSTTSPEAALADAGDARPRCRPTARAPWSRALAEELAAAPRLDRERFRAIANEVKARTGQKGKALFHPIRVALTGRARRPGARSRRAGDRSRRRAAADAGIPTILGCRERAAAFVRRWTSVLSGRSTARLGVGFVRDDVAC